MTSHSSIELADRLNAGCDCVSLDRGALAAELERVSPGFHDEVMAGRPSLFSASMVFVSAEHIQRMARLVAAVERVVALPAFREHVLAWAPARIATALGERTRALHDALDAAGLSAWTTREHAPHLMALVPPTGLLAAADAALRNANISCTCRHGRLRIAPHLHVATGDIARVADALSRFA